MHHFQLYPELAHYMRILNSFPVGPTPTMVFGQRATVETPQKCRHCRHSTRAASSTTGTFIYDAVFGYDGGLSNSFILVVLEVVYNIGGFCSRRTYVFI